MHPIDVAQTGAVLLTASGPDWAAQLESTSTAVAALFAFLAFLVAALAFWRQTGQIANQQVIEAKQTKVLELQAAELAASLEERRRAQVSLMFLTLAKKITVRDGGRELSVDVTLRNMSGLPVYDVKLDAYTLGVRWTGEAGPHVETPLMLPAREAFAGGGKTYIGDQITLEGVAADATFRDNAGRWWHLQPGGVVQDITDTASDDVTRPSKGDIAGDQRPPLVRY